VKALQPLFNSASFVAISNFTIIISRISSSPIFITIILKANQTPHIPFRPYFLAAIPANGLSPHAARLAQMMPGFSIIFIGGLAGFATRATSFGLAHAYTNVACPLLARLAA
jgi:hypothetical protein